MGSEMCIRDSLYAFQTLVSTFHTPSAKWFTKYLENTITDATFDAAENAFSQIRRPSDVYEWMSTVTSTRPRRQLRPQAPSRRVLLTPTSTRRALCGDRLATQRGSRTSLIPTTIDSPLLSAMGCMLRRAGYRLDAMGGQEAHFWAANSPGVA